MRFARTGKRTYANQNHGGVVKLCAAAAALEHHIGTLIDRPLTHICQLYGAVKLLLAEFSECRVVWRL